MATLTGKAVSELPEATTISDPSLFAISQSGNSRKITWATLLQPLIQRFAAKTDLNSYLPLTAGNDKPLTGNVGIKSDYTDGETPSSDNYGNRLYFLDSNGSGVGFVSEYFDTSGNQGIYINTRRSVGGSSTNNRLLISIDSSGNPIVSVSNSAAWRKALGLGSNGAFPILISQGGTGQTAIESTSTVSDIATAETGYTITAASFIKWGKVAQANVSIRKTAAVTEDANLHIATLISGKRPAGRCGAVATNASISYAYVEPNGEVHVRGTVAANTTIGVYFTYLLP